MGCWGNSRGGAGQQEQIDAMHDWQDSAEKKLKYIKDRMDELGSDISLHILQVKSTFFPHYKCYLISLLKSTG